MPRLPRPPRISQFLPRASEPLRDMVNDARQIIRTGRDEIGNLASTLRPETKEPPLVIPTKESTTEESTEEVTLRYQLDRLLDDLQHLETEHLPQRGRIDGKPCDCISKASRDARRHALETVPIAARQGKKTKLFAEIADWAEQLMNIGTSQAVASGKYDEEYLQQAGVASAFRKRVQEMMGECNRCPALVDLKTYVERRKKEDKL